MKASANNPITIRVLWDDQDPANRGWSYQNFDGLPAQIHSGEAALVESGPICGRQTATAPSRARVLRSAGVRGNRYVRVIYA
jgi:hypothetical protein